MATRRRIKQMEQQIKIRCTVAGTRRNKQQQPSKNKKAGYYFYNRKQRTSSTVVSECCFCFFLRWFVFIIFHFYAVSKRPIINVCLFSFRNLRGEPLSCVYKKGTERCRMNNNSTHTFSAYLIPRKTDVRLFFFSIFCWNSKWIQ